MAESGYPGFDVTTWYGLMGPAGMSRELVMRLNAEANKALASSDLRERLGRLGLEPVSLTPEQFTAFMRDEEAKSAKIIKAASITPD